MHRFKCDESAMKSGSKRNPKQRIHIIVFISILLLLCSCLGSIAAGQSPCGRSPCSANSLGYVPINDLGTGLYNGQMGGLYPNGQNVDPPAHRTSGLALAKTIGPLNSSGQADPTGVYVLLTIGMSITAGDSTAFVYIANGDPAKNPKLVIVNGASGGCTGQQWSSASSSCWQTATTNLTNASVTPQQVVAVWLYTADTGGGSVGPWPSDANALQGELTTILQLIKQKFPNVLLTYLSSREYGGYTATGNLSYEYDTGFAVKWTIAAQINGSTSLNWDPTKGTVMAPWAAWGPYTYTDGVKPRSDGLTWNCTDMLFNGGQHYCSVGYGKVAKMLLDFFTSDSTTRPWFLANP